MDYNAHYFPYESYDVSENPLRDMFEVCQVNNHNGQENLYYQQEVQIQERQEDHLYAGHLQVPDWVNAYLPQHYDVPQPQNYQVVQHAPLYQAQYDMEPNQRQQIGGSQVSDWVNTYLPQQDQGAGPSSSTRAGSHPREQADDLEVPDWVNAYLQQLPYHSQYVMDSSQSRSTDAAAGSDLQTPDSQRPTTNIQATNAPGPSGDTLPRYQGEREVSQRGVHKVLIYNIPGSILSYVFCYHKKAAREGVHIYQCTQCKKIKKYTSIMVEEDDFLSDPTMVRHRCIPVERAKDKANKMSYECLQVTRRNPNALLRPTISYWLKVVDNIETMEWGDVEKRMRVQFYYYGRDGYASRRSAFAKAIRSNSREVDMDNIPDELRFLPDRQTFLHLQESEMHIYYSLDVVKRAIDNGLYALIADGIHQLNPRSRRGSGVRMQEGQLYTIHGACRGGFEVPLLFAIARHKREEDYDVIYGKLKEVLQSANTEDPGAEPNFRIIVDFEKAAINAARRLFPQCSIEGCVWHLSQAWVRRRNALGLLRFLKGEAKNVRVVWWWRTLKGLPFLPRDQFGMVNALRTPSADEDHPAYEPCIQFLDYLRTTWLQGPFENMWNKYQVLEHRTSNTAENYHGRLRKIVAKRHPPLITLILALRSLTIQAKARLYRMETLPHETRTLRSRDQRRREKVERAMARFEEIRNRPYITTVLIGRYCRRMSRYTSDKAI